MDDKVVFEKWFRKFEPFVETCYEDYKMSYDEKPELTYFQFAFGLYMETRYADSLALN